MVEMLGTLAIIGVLSIGGIAGYSYGMDKYRANQTINDVNLRAIDLITQLSLGHTPNLDSWKNEKTIYPMALNLDSAPTNYYIRVQNVPDSVCNMISEMVSTDVKILVDNDTHSCAAGDNVMDFSYNALSTTAGVGTESGDVCPDGTSADGEGVYVGVSDKDGNRCYCLDYMTQWDTATSTCVDAADECSSYLDCSRGEFCEFYSEMMKDPTQKNGFCRGSEYLSNDKTIGEYWTAEWYGGNSLMWWTMQDICASKNMRMVTISDVGCEPQHLMKGLCPAVECLITILKG